MNKTVVFNPILTRGMRKKINDTHLVVVPEWAAGLPRRLSRFLFGELGAAGAWVFPDAARTSLLNGTFDIDTDTYKMALFKDTSNIGAGSVNFADLTNECSTGNYAAGGIAVALTLAGTTTVTVDITTDPVWTVSVTTLVARFAVIYEVGGKVLCYCFLDATPADVSVTVGNTLTVAAHASGIFTLA